MGPELREKLLQLDLPEHEVQDTIRCLEEFGVDDEDMLDEILDQDLIHYGFDLRRRRIFFGFLAGLREEQASKTGGPRRIEIGSVDKMLETCSFELVLQQVAEKILNSCGPMDITTGLASAVSVMAPELVPLRDESEWPQAVKAIVQSCDRFRCEEGEARLDEEKFSSRQCEVVALRTCWLRVCQFLARPAQLLVMETLSSASQEAAADPSTWKTLLKRWYPKATLLNPDWVAQQDLLKQLETSLDSSYTLAALTLKLDADMPYSLDEMRAVLPQQTTPAALIKFMSTHPDNFRQGPNGKFCVCRSLEELKNCQDWPAVNPFQTPSPSSVVRPAGIDLTAAGLGADDGVEKELHPKQAFRMYNAGLISQNTDQSKRGKLEAWEYFTESNSKCTLAPSDLLNLAESRVNSVRYGDPAVVHELVAQTLEGLVFKIKQGFYNRRVRVLMNALNGSQLRLGSDQRKKLERKLNHFMEFVQLERGFGFFQCDSCKLRWRSGFAYDETLQECVQCGHFQKPYRICDLDTQEERQARARGEVVERKKARKPPSQGKGVPKSKATRM